MFTAIQKIIPKAINKLGLKRETEAALVCEKYRKLAPQLIHPRALEHTTPKFFRGKTLTISVKNSAWAQMVMINKEIIISAINNDVNMKRKTVENLKTQVAESLRTC